MESQPDLDNLNEVRLKKIIINFERRNDENQRLRIKHPDDPNKFAVSETELFAALDELQSVATQPELYHVLVAKRTLTTLLSLLSHENSDISSKIIGILQEFTDLDEQATDQTATEALIKDLLERDVIGLIVSNLSRFDEGVKDEAQAINNSLDLLDNLIDFDSKIASIKSEQLIKWMLAQLRKRSEFTPVKLSISELLSVLMMSDKDNKLHLGELGGIDVLLQQVAYYRRIAPVTGDEHEYLEQVINCLCIAVLNCDENRKYFYAEEGVDLVELVLRDKRAAALESNIKLSTLKLFNHVLTTDKNQDLTVTQCCERFISIMGLRVLFPIINNPKLILSKKIKRREYHQVMDEIEEHSSAIVLALLKYCQDPVMSQRVLVKFAESGYGKFDRLIELHDKYFKMVQNLEEVYKSDEDTDKDDGERANLGNRLFTLRTIDYIILLTCYLSNHFEIYDPTSGETFNKHMSTTLTIRPELRHQIVMGTRNHIEEVANSVEELNSLKMLLEHFEGINKTQSPHNKVCH